MIDYTIIRSGRKTIAIEVRGDGEVLVRIPKQCTDSQAEEVVRKKQAWILKTREELMERVEKAEEVRQLTDAERKLYREKAREVFQAKTAYYAGIMGVTYGRIAVREQKTRWGSCSSEGNLNFNWKLILAPAGVLDYVVVHELAHRKQMNHSRAFWREVEQVMPEYQRYREWLQENTAVLHRY